MLTDRIYFFLNDNSLSIKKGKADENLANIILSLYHSNNLTEDYVLKKIGLCVKNPHDYFK